MSQTRRTSAAITGAPSSQAGTKLITTNHVPPTAISPQNDFTISLTWGGGGHSPDYEKLWKLCDIPFGNDEISLLSHALFPPNTSLRTAPPSQTSRPMLAVANCFENRKTSCIVSHKWFKRNKNNWCFLKSIFQHQLESTIRFAMSVHTTTLRWTVSISNRHQFSRENSFFVTLSLGYLSLQRHQQTMMQNGWRALGCLLKYMLPPVFSWLRIPCLRPCNTLLCASLTHFPIVHYLIALVEFKCYTKGKQTKKCTCFWMSRIYFWIITNYPQSRLEIDVSKLSKQHCVALQIQRVRN